MTLNISEKHESEICHFKSFHGKWKTNFSLIDEEPQTIDSFKHLYIVLKTVEKLFIGVVERAKHVTCIISNNEIESYQF